MEVPGQFSSPALPTQVAAAPAFTEALLLLKRAIWLVARLLGSHSSLKAVSTNAAHLFHTLLTYFIFPAGHRHCWFYHLQSGSPRTLRTLFPRKAKWRSGIIAQPREQEQCCCVRRGAASVRNVAWLRAGRELLLQLLKMAKQHLPPVFP